MSPRPCPNAGGAGDGAVEGSRLNVHTQAWNQPVVGCAEVPKACEASLGRLGVTFVDLYMIHAPFAGPGGGRLEQWRGMLAAQEAGLCKSVGVSNFGLAHLQVMQMSRSNLVLYAW